MTDTNTGSTISIGTKRSFVGEISKLRRNQQVLTGLVLLFVVVIFWIIVSLFSSQRDSKISPELQKLATPLNPAINDTVFTGLEDKRVFSEEELADFPIMIQVDMGKGEKKVVPLGTSAATPTPRPITTPTPTMRPSLLNEDEVAP